MAVGRSDPGVPEQYFQYVLVPVLEIYPLERIWSNRPLATVTYEVLEMSEVRDARGGLHVSPLKIREQIVEQQDIILGQLTDEFRSALAAALVAVFTFFGVFSVLFSKGVKGFDVFSTGSVSLSSRLDKLQYLLAEWKLGKLKLITMLRDMFGLLGSSLSPRYGWLLFSANVVVLVFLGWLCWRSVRIAVRAYRHWRDKLREAVLTQVRAMLNAIACERGITVLVVDRATGLHGHDDPGHLVPQPEMKRIRVLTEELGAGVVAVSGDRGVGKTTLLRALADPRYSGPDSTELRLMVAAPVDYDAREFLVYLYLSLCDLVLWEERPHGAFSSLLVKSRWRRLLRLLASLLAWVATGGFVILIVPSMGKQLIDDYTFLFPFFALLTAVLIALPTSNSPIAELAHRRRRELMFQQTVGQEHTGGLPSRWLVLTRRTSQQLADRPMTMPELVASYRQFAEHVIIWWRARHEGRGSMVVGIDEVDRIADAAQAERFLNEVKSIFGVHHCTYLVSVSEEALASFERRVVRVRTVLESAFDEVLRINALDLDQALDLVRRRVIGVPAPFVALCHCLSGGVARDLIRVARVMLDARRDTELTKLDELAVEVVDREVQTLTRGFATRIANLAIGSVADGLLDLLAEPGWPGHNAARILAAVRIDLLSIEQDTAVMSDPEDNVTSLEQRIESARAYEIVDALATVRGALPVSSGLVRRRLDRVRSRLGLQLLAKPADVGLV